MKTENHAKITFATPGRSHKDAISGFCTEKGASGGARGGRGGGRLEKRAEFLGPVGVPNGLLRRCPFRKCRSPFCGHGNSCFFRYMLKVLEGIAFLKGFGDFWIAKVDLNEIWSKKAPKRHPKTPPFGHLGGALGHLGAPLGGPWVPLGPSCSSLGPLRDGKMPP